MISSASVLAPDTQLARVATNFRFTEGPNWCDAGSYLVFSDIPEDTIWRWDDQRGLGVYRKPSNMANGGVFDTVGRLITCRAHDESSCS